MFRDATSFNADLSDWDTSSCGDFVSNNKIYYVQQYQAWYPISYPLFFMVWLSMKTHAFLLSTLIPNDNSVTCSGQQPVLTKTCLTGMWAKVHNL